jgi:phospholipid/cholesterol/gamma-HCH transport system permease protein
VIGLIISVGGAMVVASVLCGVNFMQFASSIPKFVGLGTFLGGMFKSFIYGNIVAGVACYKGYTASGGARGVGKAVTLAAVYTNFYIVIANFVSSNMIEYVDHMYQSYMGGLQ